MLRYKAPAQRNLLVIDDEPDWRRRWFATTVVATAIGPFWILFVIRSGGLAAARLMDWIVTDRAWADRFGAWLERVEDWALRVGKSDVDPS